MIATAGTASGGEVASSESIPRHLALARELVATVRPENNKYSYTGPHGVRWKGDLFATENSVNTMCTGLVSAVLERAKSPTTSEIKSKSNWKGYLRVTNYFEAVTNGYGLEKIDSLKNASPGDLFVFLCKDTCSSSEGPALGHVAIIDVKPVQKSPTPPLIEGTLQWVMTVIDSSDVPHSFDDTRLRPQNQSKVTGVGRGTYRIYTDMTGVPLGYTNGPRGPKFLSIDARPIAIGRPVPY